MFWHSFDVLKQIFNFLKDENKISGIKKFIKFMLPNYIISIIIGAVLLISVYFLNIDLKITSVIFLFIASLTLPHVVIMGLFNNRKNKNIEN